MRRFTAVRGFTLIELLVAITVLSLVSLISWRGLESLSATRARLEPEAEDIRAMLTVFGQMEIDVARAANPNFVPMPTPPVSASGIDGGTLEIVRFAPGLDDEASALQFVVYRVSAGQLVRQITPPLHSAGLVSQAAFAAHPLLDHVRALRVRFWRNGQGWSEVADETTPAPGVGASAGIEVTVERDDGTSVRRVLISGTT